MLGLCFQSHFSQEIVLGQYWVWDAEGASWLDTAPVSSMSQEEDLWARKKKWPMPSSSKLLWCPCRDQVFPSHISRCSYSHLAWWPPMSECQKVLSDVKDSLRKPETKGSGTPVFLAMLPLGSMHEELSRTQCFSLWKWRARCHCWVLGDWSSVTLTSATDGQFVVQEHYQLYLYLWGIP